MAKAKKVKEIKTTLLLIDFDKFAYDMLKLQKYVFDLPILGGHKIKEFIKEAEKKPTIVVGIILSLAAVIDRQEDTMLKLAHFRLYKRKAVKKNPGKTSSFPFHKPKKNHPPGKDSSKKISNLIGKAKNFANSAKTKNDLLYLRFGTTPGKAPGSQVSDTTKKAEELTRKAIICITQSTPANEDVKKKARLCKSGSADTKENA
ncbi:hypothetical protein Tco_1275421 [Tanacetum coccineum]